MKVNKLAILFLFGFIFTTSANALDENRYEEAYQENVLPLLGLMKDGQFGGEKNISIHYKTYLQANAKNCLVILPGRTEPVEKYAEVVFDLSQTSAGKNLNFFLMDHRGQGSSGRMKSPSDMGYVDHFENYVKDVWTFVQDQKLEERCEKRFLLAHSMGAGIATAFVLAHPDYFHKMALTSPMLKIMTKPYAYPVAKMIVKTSTLLGRGAKFAPGQKGYNPDTTFEETTETTSPVRYKMMTSIFEKYPKTKLGGASNKWILETMKGTNAVRSLYHQISTPLLVFHAGVESYCEPSEMIKLCEEAVNCTRTLFPTSKHEVLMDRDINRSKAIDSIAEFFN